ncbi:MAG: hypothetical protein R3213_09155 [Flavobacteriaceae bacterium]|nr:hypothetical protein [Flavobacteriaceae bacterium]
MKYLIIFVLIVLALQIGMMFLIRWKKKKDKEENVLLRYNINSPADAWRCLNDPAIPDEDKAKIQEYYSESLKK